MTAKVLVIEDVDYLREDVLSILSMHGFDVRGAENGRIGVDVARHYRPDVIVCDIMMPEMDGYEVYDTLRYDAELSSVPFIFLTAKTDRKDMRYAMSIGADDFLTKPFQSSELIDSINARLSRRHVYEEYAEQRVNELLDKISTSLPHELRTPLASMIGFSEMMMHDAEMMPAEHIIEWAKFINSGATRLYHVIENYLTYVRLESIRRDAHRQAELLTHTTATPQEVIEAVMLKLAKDEDRFDDLDHLIQCTHPVAILDRDMRKVVEEILSNAFKFSRVGTPVIVNAYDEGDMLVIRIRDHGWGISPRDQQRVSAYMQFDRLIHEQQGLGLGLIIAKRTAEIYGGSLSIESQEKQFTEITIHLPHRK